MNHFTIEELTKSEKASKLGIDNTPPKEYLEDGRRLIEMLDKIRDEWGSPIIVSSGYRCSELNDALKGSKTSQHLYFQAVDIVPKNGETENLFNLIVEMIQNGSIKVSQLIDEFCYRWIHIGIQSDRCSHKNQILHLT